MESHAPTAQPLSTPTLLQPHSERDPGCVSELPAPLTLLIGRERESAAARTLLERDDVRLLTFTGPSGVGKTQLALAVARKLSGIFADGAVFVPLAPVSDPALVASAIAQTFDVRDSGARPLLEGLRIALRDQELLLLLDNYEHVLAAAALVVDLLTACPRLKVLVTSRAMLHVTGERALVVPPLGLPDATRSLPIDQLSRYDAVRLFATRAQEAQPDFVLTAANAGAVAQICQSLDGLPLAIELAATRVRVLSPPDMLAQLTNRLPLLTGGRRDAPARLQTMRQAIDWSYDLLSLEEKSLFRHLSVFIGGFSLDTAQAIMADRSVLDDLSALVDKSLVQQGEPLDCESRFSMMETIREYGLEQLGANGETDIVRARHAVYFTGLAEQATPTLNTAAETSWFRRLNLELPNLRAAMAWAAEQDADELLLRLTIALWQFWEHHASLAEGYSWLERAVANTARLPAALDGTRAVLLAATARAATWRGEVARATALLDESLALAQATGDARAMAHTVENLAFLAIQTGDHNRAAALADEALTRWRELAVPACTFRAMYLAGYAAGLLGENDRAEARFTECLEAAHAIGDDVALAAALEALGTFVRIRGDLRRAATLCAESLALLSEGMGPLMVANCLKSLGAVAAVTGKAEQAARLFGAAEVIWERQGIDRPQAEQIWLEKEIAPARVRLSSDTFAAMWAAGRELRHDEAVAEALQVAQELTSEQPLNSATPSGLSRRELDVLRLLVEGLSDKEIAVALGISRRTASKHVETILSKFDVSSRTAAATYATRHELI
jgi:predicted ATPase/DNA-binding CsgD family transcriptional regulator